MDQEWIDALKALAADYKQRLIDRVAAPGLSWPETETYLRTAMLELLREIREAEEALRKKLEEDAAAADTEVLSRAFT